MAKETRASPPWAGFNAHLAADILREAASLTTQVNGSVIPSDVPGSLAMALKVPAGVVLGLAPWNAPVILAARAVAVPLAVGNTAVLKTSERCPETHGIVFDCLREVLPEGVVGMITNTPSDAHKVVEAAIGHPAIRRVNFTGSTKIGREIALLCAQHLKPVLLELGGKAPLLVLSDADLDAAVDAAIFGMFANSGQICMSTDRLIVDSAIAEEFIAKLVARAKALPAPIVGPLISESSALFCADLLFDAVSKGAKLLCGGPPNPGTAHIAPTLVDHVTPSMRISREESFGPVKGIMRVNGDEEAVKMANDTAYGLSAAVFSKSRGLEVAQRIRSGICHVNGPTVRWLPLI
jgi:benzaldehyde dehydrogenase (NAD)